jgi:Fe-S oxidoreductase
LNRPKVKVAYHDSCFLGRWNKKYEIPRDVLRQIPMVELVEMERNRENAYCCGGGNGNYYTDILGGGENSPARIRIREALASGAEVLAVSCPVCLVMFEDAIMGEGVGDRIKVLDISEILASAL